MGYSFIGSFLLPSLLLFFSSTAIIQITKNINTAKLEHRVQWSWGEKRNYFHCLTWTTYSPADRDIMRVPIQRASLDLKTQWFS